MPGEAGEADRGDGRAELVLLDGVRWLDNPVPGARSADLLAALALALPAGVGDVRLLDEVWGAHEPPSSTKALQVLVSRTRAHTHPGLVERTEHGYRLGTTDVDVLVLRSHARAARSALEAGDVVRARDEARAALGVPRAVGTSDGGPLGSLRLEAGREVDAAREVLGRALTLTGEHEEALAVLEPCHRARPDDERVLEALLRSEAGVRGAPVALVRYERHRERVRDSLGTDPGPGLQRLHVELLARDTPVRAGLLHDASRLIGRESDVAALTAMVSSSRVTSIVGAGGLGKTRLAHVLGRLSEQPVVHFVELASVTAPEGVVVEVASVLGVRDTVVGRRLRRGATETDLHTRILEQLGSAPTLLILDNCEHLVEAVADLVAVLVARAPRLRVLTTTRAPLGLAAERVYPLPELASPDAVELFRERATAARPGVRLDDERITSLVHRLDGLPLAVELAAAKVRVMSVEEIERRLENRFALLRGGSRDAPERHQTLIAVIDWSWNLLDVHQRVALRRLSVFRDGFSLDSAAEVIDVDDAVGLIAALVDQSLVRVHEGESLRYRLLETVREFGRMQLVDAGDDRATDERLRSWAVTFARQRVPRMFSRDQLDGLREVREEQGNLVDVLRRSLTDGDAVPVVQLLATLAGLWTVEGDHLKVANWSSEVEQLVIDAEVPPDLTGALRAVLGIVLANQMMFSGELNQRIRQRLASLGAGGPDQDGGDRRVRALVLVMLALAGSDGFGQPGVLDALCADPDPLVSGLALQWSSQARENSGDAVGALRDARAALVLCDDDSGPWSRALLTAQIAGLALQVGDRPEAVAAARAAIPVMERLGAHEDAVQLRALLVFAAIEGDHLDQAEHELALISAQDLVPSVFGGSMVLPIARAELALARGETAEGLRLYQVNADLLRTMVLPPSASRPQGLEPWILYPLSGALAAYARHDVQGGRGLRDDLVARSLRQLEDGGPFIDYPVTGALAFAVATWDLASPDGSPASYERAVRLLAASDRFAYSRTLPSLGWSFAEALAERRCPGVLRQEEAALRDRATVDLREGVRRLIADLAVELP